MSGREPYGCGVKGAVIAYGLTFSFAAVMKYPARTWCDWIRVPWYWRASGDDVLTFHLFVGAVALAVWLLVDPRWRMRSWSVGRLLKLLWVLWCAGWLVLWAWEYFWFSMWQGMNPG